MNYNTKSTETSQAFPYEGYRLWADYEGNAIFQDIFNDTIYRIKSRNEITPHLVFKRGALSPRPEDVSNQDDKNRQAYFFGLIESSDHVFLSYVIGGKTWRDVWSKRDGSLLLHSVRQDRPGYPFDFYVPFALPDGSQIRLQIVYAEKDKIYGMMEALDACKFIPGVKEDDNPVVVVAKLKR